MIQRFHNQLHDSRVQQNLQILLTALITSYVSLTVFLYYVRLKQFQTTVVRQRAFLCRERCVGPVLPRPLVLLSTDLCSILPPVPTLTSSQKRQPNSPSSRSFKTKNRPWTRSCRSCIHSETKHSTTVRVSVAEKAPLRVSLLESWLNHMWLPSGRGFSTQCRLNMGGSSDCPALCTNGALASTSFHPALTQHQDGSSSKDKLR